MLSSTGTDGVEGKDRERYVCVCACDCGRAGGCVVGVRSGCKHGDSSESCAETVADPGGPATQAVSGPLLQGG